MGSRPVGGQFETIGGIGQLRFPVAQLGIEYVSLQPFPLPKRKISILQGNGRQWVGLTAAEGTVEHAQFADNHAHRPAIADDVVHGEEQDVIVSLQPQQLCPEEWPICQIKGLLRRGLGQPPRLSFPFRRRQRGEIDDWQTECQRRRNHLNGTPCIVVICRARLLAVRKGGAHHLMAIHNGL